MVLPFSLAWALITVSSAAMAQASDDDPANHYDRYTNTQMEAVCEAMSPTRFISGLTDGGWGTLGIGGKTYYYRSACYMELVRRTGQALVALYGAQAPADGLTLTQFAVLDVLLRHGPQTVHALTKLTGVDRSTMAEMVTRLAKADLLARLAIQTAKGGRAPMQVSLTPKGRKALERSERAVWDAEKQLLARLTPVERGHFLNALAVTARVPLSEMFGYATTIRSLTEGRGTFSMEFDHYEEVPRNVQEDIAGTGAKK